jgi:hypothetical protein
MVWTTQILGERNSVLNDGNRLSVLACPKELTAFAIKGDKIIARLAANWTCEQKQDECKDRKQSVVS